MSAWNISGKMTSFMSIQLTAWPETLLTCRNIITAMNGKGVSVHFQKEGLVFTGADNPMNKLMLQMMGAFAEFERNLIHERQAEGIANAKKRG